MRRALALAAAGLAVLALFLALLVPRVERFANRVEGPAPPAASADARRLHAASTVVDLHADSLLWGRDLLSHSDVGQVDLPRLREGGVGLQIFTIVTQVPVGANVERTNPDGFDLVTLMAWAQGWPAETRSSRLARALLQARELERTAERSQGGLRLLRSRRDLDDLLGARARDPQVVGALLGIEGAQALDGDAANLDRLFDAGVRMIGLAHFFDNEFAGSAHGEEKGGLTPLGLELLIRMEARGVLLDLAHASPRAIDDALARIHQPPLVSHTGVQGTCPGPRNLSDDQLRAIAAAGGVIGIGFWDTAVCGTAPADIARAIRWAVDVVGDEHVALGSDFDGAVATSFDVSRLDAVTQALLDAGLPPDSIAKVLGANALRVLRQVLPGPEATTP